MQGAKSIMERPHLYLSFSLPKKKVLTGQIWILNHIVFVKSPDCCRRNKAYYIAFQVVITLTTRVIIS